MVIPKQWSRFRVPIDRSIIGMKSPPATFEVERGAIRKLARAIDDQTPEYQRGDIAPPTFPTTFRMDDVPWFQSVDRSSFIHTNQEYVYERPLVAGDVITVVERVVDVFEKQGKLGLMTFIVSETDGRDPNGALVYRARSTRLTH
jgi:hypothetical protein